MCRCNCVSMLSHMSCTFMRAACIMFGLLGASLLDHLREGDSRHNWHWRRVSSQHGRGGRLLGQARNLLPHILYSAIYNTTTACFRTNRWLSGLICARKCGRTRFSTTYLLVLNLDTETNLVSGILARSNSSTLLCSSSMSKPLGERFEPSHSWV